MCSILLHVYIITIFILCVFILESDDNLLNEDASLNSVKNILNEVSYAINIPLNYQIDTETCINDESGKYLKIIFIILSVHNKKKTIFIPLKNIFSFHTYKTLHF